MVYQWRQPIYPKVSAQDAGEHIEELRNQHGEVTAQMLVDDARPEDAVLHPCYEWDDAKAANKYRLHQSKQVMSNLMIISLSDNQPINPTRGFVNITARNEKASYQPLEIALSDDEMKYQVLKNAASEFKAYLRKYKDLIDVSKLVKGILSEMSA